MANQIAVKFDAVSLIQTKHLLAVPYKTEIHNESKTVRAVVARLISSDPRLAQTLPANQRNLVFMVTR